MDRCKISVYCHILRADNKYQLFINEYGFFYALTNGMAAANVYD